MDFVTLGETMVSFSSREMGRIRYNLDYRMRIAGAESNCAIGIQKLGYSSSWISRVGNDEFGQFILNSIRAEGVDVHNVRIDEDASTGLMFKETAVGNETKVTYYRANSAASCLTAEDLDCELISSAKILHITGITPVLSKSCCEAVQEAMRIAAAAHVKISFDPNIRLKLWKDQDYTELMKQLITQSDIVLIGRDEGKQLYGIDTVDALFDVLLNSGKATVIALKDGKNGAWAATNKERVRLDPYPCTPVDPIGAGDAFNAGFLTGILDGISLLKCGVRGAILGAKATETNGDIEGYLSREELEQIINRDQIVYR